MRLMIHQTCPKNHHVNADDQVKKRLGQGKTTAAGLDAVPTHLSVGNMSGREWMVKVSFVVSAGLLAAAFGDPVTVRA